MAAELCFWKFKMQ